MGKECKIFWMLLLNHFKYADTKRVWSRKWSNVNYDCANRLVKRELVGHGRSVVRTVDKSVVLRPAEQMRFTIPKGAKLLTLT